MFDKYFYTQYNGDIIYFEIKNVDKGAELNLYLNGDVVDQKFYTISDGFKWNYELKHQSITLNAGYSGMKSINVLKIEGKKHDLKKIKKNELRRILSSKNIYNSVNPTLKEVEEI